MKKGKVWLVGAGPGDAELLTLKARRLLEEADVILYDSLVGGGILSLIPPGTRLIDVGKRAGHAVMAQEDISATLLAEALAGNSVVRLKGGDPFLFGRGGEELELLVENNIPFEVVPGVTSAVAVPAYAGIPVTHRDFCSSVHIITGHLKDSDRPRIDFDALARLGGTLVFLMGVGALKTICESLLGAGMRPDMPAAILEKGTTADQRRIVATLQTLPAEATGQKIATPAIIVVGDVAGLAEKFHWAEDRPLGGARVIVTRPQALSSRLTGTLRSLGAEVLEIPAIRTVPIEDNGALHGAFENLRQYGWIVFTSQVGVDVFFNRLQRAGIDIRALSGIKLASIGGATAAAIRGRGLSVDCIPKKFDAVALGHSLAAAAVPGQRLLIPRARIGSPELVAILDRHGIPYDDIPVYDTVLQRDALPLSEILEKGRPPYVAFTSASTVRGFARMAEGADLSGIRAVCIGEQTAREALQHGMSPAVSDEITIDSLVAKIIDIHNAEKAGC